MAERIVSRSVVSVCVAGAVALAVAMGIGRFAFTPLLPMMLAQGELTVREGAWLASANYLGYLVGSITALAMSASGARLIRWSLLGVAITTMAMGLPLGLTGWLALRAVAGILSAWVLIFASGWCFQQLASAGRPDLRGLAFSGVGLGIAATGLACMLFMRLEIDATHSWYAMGLLTSALTAWGWALFQEHGVTAMPQPAGGLKALRFDRDAALLTLCYGTSGFGYIIPATFLPVMARQIVHDPLLFGLAWPVFGIAAAASTVVAGRAMRIVGNRRVWAMFQLLLAIGVLIPVFASGIGAIIVASILVGGTFTGITMAALNEARTVGGAGGTALITILTVAFALAQIAGPLFVTATAHAGDAFAFPLEVATASLCATGLLLFMRAPPSSG